MLHPILPTVVIENKRTAVEKKGREAGTIFKPYKATVIHYLVLVERNRGGGFGEPERSAIP